MGDHQNQPKRAPRPQKITAVARKPYTVAMFAEESPLVYMVSPSCRCLKDPKETWLGPMPSSQELAEALDKDQNFASLISGPLAEFERDFEVAVGPLRDELHKAAPLWCAGFLLACPIWVIGPVCCVCCCMPSWEKGFNKKVEEEIKSVVSKHADHLLNVGLTVSWSHRVEAVFPAPTPFMCCGVKTCCEESFDFPYVGEALVFGIATGRSNTVIASQPQIERL